jgi:hypothetical protein
MNFGYRRSQSLLMGLRLPVLLLAGFIPPSVSAILFYSTGDPTYNTMAPSGALANSGWQYEGVWVNDFLGTPISPHHFITAKHIYAGVGNSLVFNGQTYQTIALYDDPETDLRIGQVCGTFPYYAPLYTNNNEVGKPLVVFGKGTRRGDPVYVDSVLKGWLWGIPDGYERWGENQVAAITNAGPGLGDWLQMYFTSTGNSNHATLSVGDSGGGVFIQENSTWKLAGINISVDGPYNTDT